MTRVTKTSFILLLLFPLIVTAEAVGFPRFELELQGYEYQLELADTPQRQARGMMFRSELSPDEGMLFVYLRPQQVRIWMKNTLIPLAVIWLDEQARVVDKRILLPCKQMNCPIFGPLRPIRYVLELHPSVYARFHVGQRLSSLDYWSRNEWENLN